MHGPDLGLRRDGPIADSLEILVMARSKAQHELAHKLDILTITEYDRCPFPLGMDRVHIVCLIGLSIIYDPSHAVNYELQSAWFYVACA
ncbi:hypothetical protein VNO77_18771 [Canavalia gladiata]|uniref:Uncharacterized protein n=1 Tax=Canavalia gladiata TaxID=3824 RepID=A0AAN9LLB7_CANGL